MSDDVVQRLLLTVNINGTLVEQRPIEFSLWTDRCGHGVISHLLYPLDMESGARGDVVEVLLAEGEEESLLFSGVVGNEGTVQGNYRKLYLVDGCDKLYDTFVVPAYRKEKVSVMLQDTLEAAGISDRAISCPDVELARLSLDRVTAAFFIELLAKVLEEYSFSDIHWFFDSKNVFRFGTIEDSGQFQSTHPRGVRRQPATPTHPRGVRLDLRRRGMIESPVSIHAPAWGATCQSQSGI